jgi:hypothetical protein
VIVNVGVMVGLFVTVALSVGGTGVNVGVAVEVGLAKNPVPHADSEIQTPKANIIIFFI